MGDDMARRVRELETAVAVIVRHFGLEGYVRAAKDARRADAVERSEKIGGSCQLRPAPRTTSTRTAIADSDSRLQVLAVNDEPRMLRPVLVERPTDPRST